jgi:nucleotide-binding universal stress UspA family protein
MNKILFAVDGSEASRRAAEGLAGVLRWWNPTDVEIVNVQSEPSVVTELVPHALRERAEARVREAGDEALASARSMLEEAGARCTTSVRLGDAAAGIVETAAELDCRLIVVGSHGAGVISSMITGSVTSKVIHVGARPVLVIPSAQPAAASPYGPPQRPVRVLVPVDGSPGALTAVQTLIAIAPWFRDRPEVHLLAVYEGTPLDVELAAMLSSATLTEHQSKQFEAALAPAREALTAAKFEPIEHTAVGPPIDRIRAIRIAERCDMICVGALGTTTIRNLFVGSTAMKVLRAIEVPVLVVPPAKD